MIDEEIKRRIDLTIAALDKEYGKGSVIRLGSENVEPWPSISTGALTLDLALGIGGLPKGRIIEIYGMESAGKTTIALMTIARAQANGGLCAFIDAEHSLDPNYSSALGVDMDDLYLAQPSYGEEALGILDKLIDTQGFEVIVIDSVAALLPKAELEGDVGQSHVGLQARLMGQTLRKITAKAHENGAMIIFINQLREKVGVLWGNPEVTSGGRALPFYASVRIDVRKKEILKLDGQADGVKVRAKIVKNKMAPPLREAEFDILYGRGIDQIGCILDLAEARGLIKKGGAWYRRLDNDEIIGQGRAGAIQGLAGDMDFTRELERKILYPDG